MNSFRTNFKNITIHSSKPLFYLKWGLFCSELSRIEIHFQETIYSGLLASNRNMHMMRYMFRHGWWSLTWFGSILPISNSLSIHHFSLCQTWRQKPLFVNWSSSCRTCKCVTAFAGSCLKEENYALNSAIDLSVFAFSS